MTLTLEALTATSDWNDFYVIVGGSAGALAGLMFVVISLGSERRRNLEAFEAYATPTIVDLATVLYLAALITVPKHSDFSLSLCLAGAGVGGLLYGAWIVRQTLNAPNYSDYWSDWIWRHIVPGFVYVALLIAAAIIWVDQETALYVTGACALVMLLTSVHNAWDSAIWIASDHPEDQ